MLMPPQTLAHFDGDVDEAPIVARIIALRQDPDWGVALHNGNKRCAIVLTHRSTGDIYRVYLDRVKGAEGAEGAGQHNRSNGESRSR